MLENNTEKTRRVKLDCCFYCRDDNQEIIRDHVKPSSIESVSRYYDEGDIVDCCRECNNLLENCHIQTVEERADYLISKLTSRYRKVLTTPDWTEEEIAEEGRWIQSKIRANMVTKKWVVERLQNLAEISVGLYDIKETAHLRGLTTKSKVIVYHMISEFLNAEGSIPNYKEYWSNYLDVPEKDIDMVLNEKYHYDVATTVKLERGLPLDLTLKQHRSIIKKSSSKPKKRGK